MRKYYSLPYQQLPRMGENADCPGAYELIARLDNSVINKGDKINIHIFITGYGMITNPKFLFYPSSKVFDFEESSAIIGIKVTNNEVEWGEELDMKMNDYGITIVPAGLYNNWKDPTMFFDMTDESPTRPLSTERCLTENAPFTFNLKTQNKVLPGDYELQFILSYFNGNEWRTSILKLKFKVNNLFERYQNSTALLGIGASLMALIAVIFQIMDYYK